ncbi:MAG: SDR family NAD(P)-dependent oxidoreductase [Acidobacteria bacterium]|nr:SDR family NAD(P)-dependent oxidoreductase [Acidobacteriota bacterium]
MRKLENKVVIVTGASSGIGAATARLFAAEGASLALASRAIHKLQALADSLGPRAIAIETDITDPVQVQEMVRRCAERFGRIDMLINNAGVGMYGSIAKMPLAQLNQLVATNWLGPVYAIQAVVPYMQRQGGGQIINVSSVVGKVAMPWMTAYSSTKFALNALSDGLRMELKRDHIHVISVCPGRVRTPFPENALKDPDSQSFHPGGISPERAARAILRASLRGSKEIIVPASNWGFVWLHALFPRLLDWMMVRFLRQRMRKT